MRFSILLLGVVLLASAGDRSSIFMPGPKPIGPFSPAIRTTDYVYVSGQGARDPSGKLPATVEAQTKQCLENIKAIVEAAGLTMSNIVYTHTYLTDMKNYDAMNKVYATFFHDPMPARSTMGVIRMPLETPVEISAIAIRDKSKRFAVTMPSSKSPVPLSSGIMTPDRFFISGILGRNAETGVTPPSAQAQIEIAVERLKKVLRSAKLDASRLIYMNVYRTPAMPQDLIEKAARLAAPEAAISIIDVANLPFGVSVGITGVAAASKDRKVFRQGGEVVCASAGETVYCSARGAEVISDAFQAIDKGLRGMGTDITRAVSNTVYLDDIDNFAKMNAAYAKSFTVEPPARTTVQPMPAGRTGARVSVIAVR